MTLPRPSKRLPRHRGEEGFSLALALLVVLVALASGLAIAGRTLTSRQARESENRGLTARNAAEIGMTRIIAELNRPRNRRLLVNAPQLGATDRTVAQIEGDDSLRNPCDLADGNGADLSTNGTLNSGNVLNNEVTIPNTGGRLRYSLVAVNNGVAADNLSEQDADGDANTSFAVTVGNAAVSPAEGGERGEITLDVRGRLIENNTEISRYNLRKTFAVIPKCCGASFGGVNADGTVGRWGNDVNTASCGVASGYGLMLGSRRDLTDSNTRGSLSTFLSVLLERTIDGTTTNTTVSRVYCTVPTNSPVATDCPLTSTASVVRTNLTLKNITLPEVPYPVGVAGNTYAFTANQETLSAFTTTRPSATSPNNTTLPLWARWFWDSATTGTCNSATPPAPGSSGNCNVPGYARMRVCDASVSDASTAPPWLGASNRSFQSAIFSTTAPVPGCRISFSGNEQLNTRDFDNWDTAAGNTLKWHLGRLCTRVQWPWRSGATTVTRTTIYCSLDRLSLAGGTVTFDTAGTTANSSIPIILSFPNGNNTLRKINSISRPSTNVLRVSPCVSSSAPGCGGAHGFTVGAQVMIRDLPGTVYCGSGTSTPASTFNNTSATPSYTVSAVAAGTVDLTRNSMPTLDTDCTGTTAFQNLTGTIAEVGSSIGNSSSDRTPILASSGIFTASTIRQINSQRTTPQLIDMMILGCGVNQSTSCRFQQISSGGLLSTLTVRDIFVYAPYSTMATDLSFLSFRGAFWGNKLSQSISGSSFTIPAGSIDAIVDSFPSWTPAQLDLEQDYAARNVIRVGTFAD